MLETRRLPISAAAGLAAAFVLTGCMTPQSKVDTSQAVLAARAHRNVAPPPDCSAIPLSSVSPTVVGFAFEEGALTNITTPALEPAAAWLACHPDVPAVILPDADNHGPDAAQNGLARQRAEAVSGYLQAHGVAAARIQKLARGQAEPAGRHLLIRAEGRRW